MKSSAALLLCCSCLFAIPAAGDNGGFQIVQVVANTFGDEARTQTLDTQRDSMHFSKRELALSDGSGGANIAVDRP